MSHDGFGKDLLRGIERTVHGGQAWRLECIEDFSHNLNPFGPPDLSDAIMGALDDIWHYPDDGCLRLKEALGKAFSVKTNEVMVGAGSSEIIRNFPHTFLNRGDKVLICNPSFAEYSQQCRLLGIEVVNYQLRGSNDYRIDLDEYLGMLDGVKAVYICNPNNPTGRIESKDRIIRIVKECESRGILVFLDETLLDLVHGWRGISLVPEVSRFTNLVIAGSFTKSFAVPGIRIGYGFACNSLVQEMDKVRMSWNLGAIEQAVSMELLDRMDYVDKASEIMHKESKRVHKRLNDIGFPLSSPPDSFFCFCSVRPLGFKAVDFQRALLEHGVMVRDCSSFGFDDCIRFSIKDRERNDVLMDAIENVIKGRA